MKCNENETRHVRRTSHQLYNWIQTCEAGFCCFHFNDHVVQKISWNFCDQIREDLEVLDLGRFQRDVSATSASSEEMQQKGERWNRHTLTFCGDIHNLCGAIGTLLLSVAAIGRNKEIWQHYLGMSPLHLGLKMDRMCNLIARKDITDTLWW